MDKGYQKQWQKSNPKKMRLYKHRYYLKNKTAFEERRKKWTTKNPERIRLLWRRANKKYLLPKNRLDRNIRTAIGTYLKGKKAGMKCEELVGYSMERLVKYLEKQFDNKMNWSNYASYWVIDHIKPRVLFQYKNPRDPELKKCWALKNLRPMEKIANLKKGTKYPYYE